jgi:hypothetical protein
MLNEKDDIRSILRDMTKSLDGRSCIVACAVSITMATINFLIPDLFSTKNINHSEKWFVIWIVFPALALLLYLRIQQILDGSSSIWPLARSIFVLSPVFVLAYFNFKG